MQNRAASKQAEATMGAANEAATRSHSQNRLRLQQEGEVASAKAFDRMQQAARERAKIRAASALQGVSGVGASRALSISDVNAAIDTGRIYDNLDRSNLAFLNNSQNIEATRKGRFDQAKASVASEDTQILQMGLSGIQGAMGGYSLGGGTLFGGSSAAGGTSSGATLPKNFAARSIT
jgi:hypothetical protein